MKHSDLLRLYGTGTRAALALGYTKATVWTWKDRGIPLRRQYEIQAKTRGRLKADPPKSR